MGGQGIHVHSRQLSTLPLRHRGLLIVHSRATGVAFALALLTIVVTYTLSGTLYGMIWSGYSAPGGFPLVKFHPSTYLAALAASWQLMVAARERGGIGHLFSETWLIFVYMFLVIFSALYSAWNVGTTGTAVYIDTYLSAGLIAIALARISERQCRLLSYVILTLCVLNITISVGEALTQEHLIPVYIDGDEIWPETSNEFRGAALYSHPLTGALATSLAVFLCLGLETRFSFLAILFATMSVGLLSFGGRAALGVSVVLIVSRTGIALVRDFKQRTMSPRIIYSILLVFIVLVPLIAATVSYTTIGDRIIASSYYDDSADVRAHQWLVFSKMSIEQIMFGADMTEAHKLYYQIGLKDVESPIIIMLMSLGALGFPILVLAVICLILYLIRNYPASRWLVCASMIIISTNNSIGVKSPDFVMMTVCAIAMSRRSRPLPLVRAARSAMALRRRYPIAMALSKQQGHANPPVFSRGLSKQPMKPARAALTPHIRSSTNST